ncbi:UNVERIFIED_CONTAM: hypothetical protein Slati_2316100 [Sesamum latifolium]|uniref:Uncharacterized protein n=1 Tax=Sesamum latifolium TaxID=2727402 RepID=A0AAW2WCB1_9LAMI
MATLQIHSRSISLPARLDHPVNPTSFDQFDLQKWQISKTAAPVSSEGIQAGLLGLAELYNSVQELAQPRRDVKSIEESLSGSVELLDSCTAIRELFQMIRENVQALQSALRRKGLDSGVQSDISSYFCFRKKMNKCVAKTLKALKNFESRNGDGFDNVFREVAGVTVAIFRSILVFLSSPASARSGGWSLVSRLMVAKPAAENGGVNEVGSVDFALSSLQGKLRSNGAKAMDVQKRLQDLEAVMEGFEGGLERVFRQLVRSRVTLLNILTDH